MRLWNATYLASSTKLLYFEAQISTFVGISKKLPHFYWKWSISSEIHKFATFRINYVKLKLWSAPPQPIYSGKYTGATGLMKFDENI